MNDVNFRSLFRWWIAMLSLPLLVACGGGDGDLTPQLSPAITASIPGNAFTANLSGAQEVPATPSAAVGVGAVVVDPLTQLMQASLHTGGITATAVHIHEGAPGVSGPVVFAMTQSTPGSGIWTALATLSEAQRTTLQAGNYYFNVHSPVFPEGEIRGQIRPGSDPLATPPGQLLVSGNFRAMTLVLTAGQVVPPSTSSAELIGLVLIDTAAKTLSAGVLPTDEPGSAVQISAAAQGSVGPRIFPLLESTPGTGIWGGLVTLTDGQQNALLAGDYYFQVATPSFPNGEVRAQIVQRSPATPGGATVTGATAAGTTTGTTFSGVTSGPAQ